MGLRTGVYQPYKKALQQGDLEGGRGDRLRGSLKQKLEKKLRGKLEEDSKA